MFISAAEVAGALLVLGTVGATTALAMPSIRPSTKNFILIVAAWIAMQRFIAAGYRIPGRARLSKAAAAGKVAVVTGANTGIGLWTAVGLVQGGAETVVITCRNAAKAAAAVAEIKRLSGRPDADVRGLVMELGSLKSVRGAADAFKAMGLRLDIMVNNAGAVVTPKRRQDVISEDGLELGFGANFIGPVLFTEELMPLLRASRGRIVNVSSVGHSLIEADAVDRMLDAHPHFCSVPHKYNSSVALGLRTYCLSKLGNVYYTQWITETYPEVTAVALHPGVVLTDIWRNIPMLLWGVSRVVLSLFAKTSAEGAVTSLHCALADNIVPGAYYVDQIVRAKAPGVETFRRAAFNSHSIRSNLSAPREWVRWFILNGRQWLPSSSYISLIFFPRLSFAVCVCISSSPLLYSRTRPLVPDPPRLFFLLGSNYIYITLNGSIGHHP